MSDIAIRVENLGKRYRLGQMEPYRTLRESLMGAGRRLFHKLAKPQQPKDDPQDLWALKDVSFEVKQGEVVGIIGRNGAGKSTLLKILSRITEPTTGRAELNGRVGSLLEVGTGFHPELTGRENIYLNGAILGMTRAEIKSKFDEIVAFSEVEKFIDTPVKRYSSGMYVRLAFAVAAHLEPEILVVDEVLAVGDQAFQNKCIGKMSNVAQHGRTVLFVSHNMAAVEALCGKAVLLESGNIKHIGTVSDTVARYLDCAHQMIADIDLRSHARAATSRPLINRLRLLDRNGTLLKALRVGQSIRFELSLDEDRNIPDADIVLRILGPYRERIAVLQSRFQLATPISLHRANVVVCEMMNCRLMPGWYKLDVLVRNGRKTVDEVTDLQFEVAPSDIYGTGNLPSRRAGFLAPEVHWSEAASGVTCNTC